MKRLDDMTEPELLQLMTHAAEAVRLLLPPDTGFVILAADFGPGGVAQYVGNGRRSDFIKWMREAADRLEAKEDIPR